MFNAEVRAMLWEVIRSWQVIAVTVFILIYITIVRRVANIYLDGRRRSAPKKRKIKKEKADVPAPTDSDDLGLEEESPQDEIIDEE